MRKYTIYAVDFDGTLCESVWPDIGAPNMALIEHLIKRRRQGNKVILWTCRVDERLQAAVDWCRNYGLEFDAVNDNLPEMVEYWKNNPRKVFADVYIDDKFKNKPKYDVPFKTEKDMLPAGTSIFDMVLSALPHTPFSDDGEKRTFWAEKDGESILCRTEEGSRHVADIMESLMPGIVAKTGYYDPEEDARNGETNEYTGFYYVEVE